MPVKAKKPMLIDTHCDNDEYALWLVKKLGFRRHSNGTYYRKRPNRNTTAKYPFEHDKAVLEGHIIHFTYKYQMS